MCIKRGSKYSVTAFIRRIHLHMRRASPAQSVIVNANAYSRTPPPLDKDALLFQTPMTHEPQFKLRKINHALLYYFNEAWLRTDGHVKLEIFSRHCVQLSFTYFEDSLWVIASSNHSTIRAPNRVSIRRVQATSLHYHATKTLLRWHPNLWLTTDNFESDQAINAPTN